MRRRTATGDPVRRSNYTEAMRGLVVISERLGATGPHTFTDQLTQLEAGERVRVSGWEVDGVDVANDYKPYWLEPDGSLTPVDPG